MSPRLRLSSPLVVLVLGTGLLAACGSSPQGARDGAGITAATGDIASGVSPTVPASPTTTTRSVPASTTVASSTTTRTTTVTTAAHAAFRAGNPDGGAAIPDAATAVDTSHPTRVVGHGTAASCTSAAVVAAVAAGGIISFSCGPNPVTITMTRTAKVRNAHGPVVVLDGGGKVTLSGGGKHRILYMDTCDQAQGWTTSHCQDQSSPRLTVQNLTFADGNSTGETMEGGGGGAIFVRGGRFKVVNSVFLRNRCDSSGPDLGGAAIRVLDQYQGLPVYVVNSTFGGASGQGGRCSNGGALSSIGVSWVVLNSLFSYNAAIGHGANPARSGTAGGGSGGALYTDGNDFTVRFAGCRIEHNKATEGGGAVFFVSNDRTGHLAFASSVLRSNRSAGFETAGYPGVFFLGAGHPSVTATRMS